MLERKKNAEKERNSTIRETGMPVKNEKIKSKSKMDECRAEWKGQRHWQARKKGDNQRIQIQQKERCMTKEIPEYLERENARERKRRFLLRRKAKFWKTNCIKLSEFSSPQSVTLRE
jgi:hypothetical protein